jgi:hypothetical protein
MAASNLKIFCYPIDFQTILPDNGTGSIQKGDNAFQ